jgi:NADPH:quinone reductase-like Zn-dependent oxidoreductase
MRALVNISSGTPASVRLQPSDVETPTPGDHEVLLRVSAAGVNPADALALLSQPTPTGPDAPPLERRILGTDVSGTVAALGAGVERLRVGDEVFGWCLGAFAEYAVASEGSLLTRPSGFTFVEAAAVPLAALTALQLLRDVTPVRPGQAVLINGASGGVGTFAVQIAKTFGAVVTAVCSTRNTDLVWSLGADHVIDYTRDDFTESGRRYDFILDNAASQSLAAYRRALTSRGTLISNHGVGAGRLLGLAREAEVEVELSPPTTTTQTVRSLRSTPNLADLGILKALLETGKVKPVIERTFPLSAAAQALAHVARGHTRGKVVITLVEAPPPRD